MRHIVLVLVLVLVLVPGATAAPPDLSVKANISAPSGPPTRTPSRVVYPPEPRPRAFSHARHAGVTPDCLSCHAAARTSTSAADSLAPVDTACQRCHADHRVTPRPERVTPHLRFSHATHVSRAECAACHPTSQLDTPGAALPLEAVCLGCHDGKAAARRCAACHEALPTGRLRTTFAEGRLQPQLGALAHGPTFRRDHARPARLEPRTCDACHVQRFCADCHQGVIKPFDFHGGDYISLHVLDARKNDPDCSACHRRQTFCIACHQRLGVASDPTGGDPAGGVRSGFGPATGRPGRFHPAGWARDTAGVPTTRTDASHHALQAQRNLRSCASCHREETCLRCHASARGLGPGGTLPADTAPALREPGVSANPHGPGFASSARCRALSSRNQRVCAKCHDPRDPAVGCR